MKLTSIVEFFDREQNLRDEIRQLLRLLNKNQHFCFNFNTFDVSTAPNNIDVLVVQDIVVESNNEEPLTVRREVFLSEVEHYLSRLDLVSSTQSEKRKKP
jgi:hypothetical protein